MVSERPGIVLRVWGLPYKALEQEVVDFLNVPENKILNVIMDVNDQNYRPSGICWVVVNDFLDQNRVSFFDRKKYF